MPNRSKMSFPAAMIVAAFVFVAMPVSTAKAQDDFSMIQRPTQPPQQLPEQLADQPTPQPAARPTSRPVDQIHKWFDELSDTDPAVRDEARLQLMGLPREQLGVLRELA